MESLITLIFILVFGLGMFVIYRHRANNFRQDIDYLTQDEFASCCKRLDELNKRQEAARSAARVHRVIKGMQ